MTDDPVATSVLRAAERDGRSPVATLTLSYDERLIRRKRLTAGDVSFVVDLASVTNVEPGDCFALPDGRLIEVAAAVEPVLVITGDLARLAWHIGNRHTPCQIEADRLLIRQDHVLEDMVRRLGGTISRSFEAFRPEGGAYGHGRTFGHEH